MSLTDYEIRIKVAESLGYEFSLWGKDWLSLVTPSTTEPIRLKLNRRTVEQAKLDYICALPNYPESLDACVEFEATLTRAEWFQYNCYLFKALVPFDEGDCWDADNARHCISATPRQRCLAYLKTKGLNP